MDQEEMSTAELKEFIFDLLKHYKVSQVVFEFNGSGDSGEINGHHVMMEKGVNEIDLSDICDDIKKAIKFGLLTIKNGSEFNGKSWVPTFYAETDKLSLNDVIEIYCYKILELSQPGWEIDYGSNGNITLLVADNEATVDINLLTTENSFYRY